VLLNLVASVSVLLVDCETNNERPARSVSSARPSAFVLFGCSREPSDRLGTVLLHVCTRESSCSPTGCVWRVRSADRRRALQMRVGCCHLFGLAVKRTVPEGLSAWAAVYFLVQSRGCIICATFVSARLPIGWKECLQNELCCVEWNVKP